MTQELLGAVTGDDVAAARRLLDGGADPETTDDDGRTLLMIAARDGHVGMAQLLLERGANINAVTNHGLSALMTAGRADRRDVVRLLIANGAEVNAQTERGATALTLAAMRGAAGAAADLLEAGANPNLSGEMGPPTQWASSLGNIDILRMLIQHGAAVDAANPNTKTTPLGGAAMKGRLDCVNLLLDAGASPNGSPGQPVSPLRIAIVQGHQEIVRALLSHGARTVEEDGVGALTFALQQPEIAEIIKDARGTDLHDAAKAGDLDRMITLLNARPGVDRRDDRDRTVLMMAAETGQVESVRLLLGRGADPNAADKYQHNALIRAAAKGYKDIVKLLLDHGANVSTTNQWGQTALHRAATAGHTETMGLLIAAGAAVSPAEAAILGDRENLERLLERGIDLPNEAGMTGLMGAAAAGRLDLTRELLDRGANPDTVDRRDQTALHWAVRNGHVDVAEALLGRAAPCTGAAPLLQTPIFTENIEMIRLLLGRGVDPNHLENLDSCALKMAIKAGKDDVLELLLENKADPNGPTGIDVPPLSAAARTGNETLVRILLLHGADPNRAHKNGSTPLAEAAERGHLAVVRMLLDQGARIKSDTGMGAHVTAAIHGHADILRLLIERGGFELLKPGKEGIPEGAAPLIIAAALGKTEIVDLYRAGGEIELPAMVKKLIDLGTTLRGTPDGLVQERGQKTDEPTQMKKDE